MKEKEEKIVRTVCQGCHSECGVLVHVAKGEVVGITADEAHPSTRGHICIKGRHYADFLYHPDRLKYPLKRIGGKGEGKWQRISWDDALDRIAKLMKADRDANFVETTEDGKKVNRWLTTGMLAASAASNEVGYLTHKTARSMGMLAFDNQARV